MKTGRIFSLGIIMAVMTATPCWADDTWGSTVTYQSPQQSGCDNTVATQITQAQAATITQQTAMARDMYPFLDDAGLGAKSCLQNVMSMVGGSGSFTPPSFSTLEQNLQNFACNEATSYVNTYKSDLQNMVSSYAQDGENAVGSKIGEIVPGVNLGSVPVQVMSGGNGLSSNLGSALGQTQAEGEGLYEGLFGKP